MPIAGAMVAQQAIAVDEGLFLQEGLEKVGADPGMDQDDRLPGSSGFVRQVNALISASAQAQFI